MTVDGPTRQRPREGGGKLSKEEMLESIVERWGAWLDDARVDLEHSIELEARRWFDQHNDIVYNAIEMATHKWLERHREEIVGAICEGAKFSLSPPKDFWKSLKQYMAKDAGVADPPEPRKPARAQPPLTEPEVPPDPMSDGPPHDITEEEF